MIRNVLTHCALAAALAVTIPAVASAQAEPTTPEGLEWHLVWYASEGDLAAVPWSADATLLLEDGDASGSSGCNDFGTTYEIDGDSLTFDEAISITEMACPEPQMAVESGYMAALAQAATWSIDDSLVGDDAALALYDVNGENTLVFALPVVGLTQADVVALATRFDLQQAKIDRLDERLDNVKIGVLRDRIKTLEAEVKQLRTQASSSTSKSAFSAAEKVLLEAIPAGIRKTCTPRRSQNPSGTVAAVQCKPSTAKVDMAYYLMEDADAGNAWDARIDQYGVKDGPGSCRKGKKDAVYYTGGLELHGCYVNENGKANLRYAVAATDCRQLKAGNTRLKRPALYIAVLGPDNDIAKLTKWAEPTLDSMAALAKTIKRPKEAWSDACPT